MSYTKKVIQPGEQILISGKMHWMCYRRAIFLAFIGLVILLFSTQIRADKSAALIAFLSIFFFIIAALSFLSTWFRRKTTEIAVTDRRIIYKRGWLSRYTEEMNLSKVETVDVDQSIWGRLLGYGTIRIKGIGGSWEPLYYIGAPIRIRNKITAG
jgi:uncharacterized membrane protein YdbT with pleckstrin-like domain